MWEGGCSESRQGKDWLSDQLYSNLCFPGSPWLRLLLLLVILVLEDSTHAQLAVLVDDGLYTVYFIGGFMFTCSFAYMLGGTSFYSLQSFIPGTLPAAFTVHLVNFCIGSINHCRAQPPPPQPQQQLQQLQPQQRPQQLSQSLRSRTSRRGSKDNHAVFETQMMHLEEKSDSKRHSGLSDSTSFVSQRTESSVEHRHSGVRDSTSFVSQRTESSVEDEKRSRQEDRV